MSECLFCGIASGEVPATIVADEGEVLAFRDINPQAPTHLLVIPREHLESVADVNQEKEVLWGHLLRLARQLARDEGIAESGFRIVANTGRDGGQTVSHLHLHLLGGRPMAWPPG
jgi:histidine triad (HIT) family protein